MSAILQFLGSERVRAGNHQLLTVKRSNLQCIPKGGQTFPQPIPRTLRDRRCPNLFVEANSPDVLRKNMFKLFHHVHCTWRTKTVFLERKKNESSCTLHLAHLYTTFHISPCFRMSRSRLIAFLTIPFVAGTMFGWAAPAMTAGLLGSSIFSDVPRGSYFDAPLGTLVDAGIIDRASRFRPGDPITRAEFAKVMGLFYQQMNGEYVPPSDNNTDDQSDNEEEVASSSSVRTRSSSSRKSSSSSSEDDQEDAGPEGAFQFVSTTFTIPETAKGLTLGVVRTGGSAGAVSVEFLVVPATATENEDYYKNGGTLSFKENETTKTFTILLKNDEKGEGPETFTVKLLNAKGGAVLGTPHIATVTVLDDEQSNATTASSSSSSATSATNPSAGTFNFSAIGYAAAENVPTLTVTVKRDGGSSGEAAVTYASTNGSAKSGTDYVNATGVLTFAANETSKTFTVTIADNGSIDGNRTFTLKLSSPTGGSGIGRAGQTTVTIMDNEAGSYGSGSIKLSKSAYDGSEKDGLAVITVQRVGGSKGLASVTYSTTSGTASGNDFTPANGTLTFLEGESTKEILVTVLKDTSADTGETFYVAISNPIGALLGTPSNATITVYE